MEPEKYITDEKTVIGYTLCGDYCLPDLVLPEEKYNADKGSTSRYPGNCVILLEISQSAGTYLWAKFDDLDKLERKLIEGPYIHHFSEIEGSHTQKIREFCKYVPNLQFDTV